MRLVRNVVVGLVLLGIAWIVAMRASAPYRHHREFTSKLPFFEKVIAEFQLSATAASTSLTKVPIPDEARGKVYSILAQRPDDTRLALEFLTGGGFPVRHNGFLFLSAGRIEDYPQMASRWPHREQVGERWYYIADY